MVSSDLGPTLVTERLILRPPVAEDFDPYAQLMAEEATARFIGGVQSRADAWRGFLTMAGAWVMQGFSFFTVVDRATGQWVGRVGPMKPEGWPGTEVAWSLGAAFHGKGYATEAATAAIDWAFDYLGWTEVIHTIHPDNVPSQAVATRLGSVNLRQAQMPSPIDIWGQSREQWRARKG
ncbi:MAG: GNAT family N-acetyltransferase [Caulobacteraceae bacterium]|nr:GNAT family N-acetyltransferase [Caulobacteraceae bacterium]